MGPTASGKTDLAIALAQQLDCELISVDSALVYRGLDVGAAKPDYPHHLIDIRDPGEAYSAAEFAADARELCAQIRARGKRPLLVGGTMLYFRALLEPLADMPGAEPAIRQAIAEQAAREGWPALHRELAAVDPEAADRIHPNHSQRLSRALEVYRATGVPLSEWHRRGREQAVGDDESYVQLAICPIPRSLLHERIALRFDQMLELGFLDEVQRLYGRSDLHPELPALRAVGYRQLWRHVSGQCTLEEARDQALAATRQLAKRQLTWLRKWPQLHWIYTDGQGNVVAEDGSELARANAGEPALALALNYLAQAPI
jgi:tRNA dimethylallyltransferase